MDEQQLKILLKNYIYGGFSSSLVEFLVEKLSIEMRQEIDKKINNLLSSNQTFNNNNNDLQIGNCMDLWFTENENNLNEFNISSKLLKSISNNLANNSLIYKQFHFKIIKLCSQINIIYNMRRRRRSNSSSFSIKSISFPKQQLSLQSISNITSIYDNNKSEEEEEETKLALSDFSLNYSMNNLPEEELCSIIGLIVDEDIKSSVRKINIRKLLFVSPLTLSRSKAFELFLGNLNSLLLVPSLFDDTMRVLTRILNCKDVIIWKKTSICLCRVALNVIRKNILSNSAKQSLAHFFFQIFSNGPYIWSTFDDNQSLNQIIQSYIELFVSEIDIGELNNEEGFISIFSKLKPSIEWIMPWLLDNKIRTLALPKLAELLINLLENREQNNSITNLLLFKYCLLLYFIRIPSLIEYLKELISNPSKFEEYFCNKIINFLTLIFNLKQQNNKNIKNIFINELFETAKSDCGANLIISSSLLNEIFNLINLNNIYFEYFPLKLIQIIFSHFEDISSKIIIIFNSNLINQIIEYIKYFYNNNNKYFYSFNKINLFEIRELCINVFILILERLSSSIEISFDQIQNLIKILMPNFDSSINSHKYLLLSPCFLKNQNIIKLKKCQKKLGKILFQLWLKSNNLINDEYQKSSIFLTFPMPIRPIDLNQWNETNNLLNKFIFSNNNYNEEMDEFDNNNSIQHHYNLKNIISKKQQHLLSPFIFVLITQPSLLIELINYSDFSNKLKKKFFEFENLNKKQSIEDLINFIEKLDLLIINLDFLVEIKHILPNLIKRLIKILNKLFNDFNGNLIFCNNLQKIALFINHLILASGEDRKYEYFNNIKQINNAINEIPNSLYLSKEEEFLNKRLSEDFDKFDLLPIKKQRKYLSAIKFEEKEEIKPIIERSFSLGIFESSEDDYFYLLSLLPNKDTKINRLKFLSNIFSEKWQNNNYSRFNPFLILKAYSTKFWMKEKNFNSGKGQFRRPPPHNEWLSLISDYALALKLAKNKSEIRQKMFGLRMFSEKTFPSDWFLSAIFLSSNLNSELTINLLECLLNNKDKIVLECLWQHSIIPSNNNISFEDYITIKIYPLVILFIQKCSKFKNIFSFLFSIKLPSLLHLLLFYTKQIYFNILPFKLIEQYLLLAILGGPKAQVNLKIIIYFFNFQALHFCAFLDNIINNNQLLLIYKNFPSKIVSLLLRPENSLINNFSFKKYAYLLLIEGENNNNNNNEKQQKIINENNFNFIENDKNIYWF